jgi:hypothetical protein
MPMKHPIVHIQDTLFVSQVEEEKEISKGSIQRIELEFPWEQML